MIGIRAIGADVLARKLERLGRELDAAEKALVVKGSLLVRRLLVKRMSARAPTDPFWGKGSPEGAFLGARTGQARQRLSPGGVAIKSFGRWQAPVGSPDKHIAFHEEGGTIYGRQFLRIPTAAAQTAGGQDRNAGRSIRGLPDVFLFRSKEGNLWAAHKEGDRPKTRQIRNRDLLEIKGLTLLYLLVRRVTLRGRGLFAATRREAQPLIAVLGNAEVKIVTARAN